MSRLLALLLVVGGCASQPAVAIPSFEEQTRDCYAQGGKVTTTKDPRILRCMFKDLNGDYK